MNRTSQVGMKLIKSFETLHDGDLTLIGLQPKMCPAGVWTEGYGHAILDSNGQQIKGCENKALAYRFAMVKNDKQALDLLALDLMIVENQINHLGLILNQHQFDAIASFTFNLGIGNFRNSTLLKLIRKNPNSFMIAYELPKWRRANGKILPGLERRRRSEASLYFTGDF